MSTEPKLPTPDVIRRQYPLVRALVRKDFRKNLYGSFPLLVIRNGILFFLACSLLALGMRNNDFSDRWTSMTVSVSFLLLGISLLIFPVHFIGGMSAETLQGTFRNLSLYPVGINSITTSKLAFSILSTGGLIAISLISILSPFLIMGVFSLKMATFICVISVLIFCTYFLIIFAWSFYANVPAARTGVQNIGAYSFLGLTVSLFLSYWPVRMVATAAFNLFDPGDRYVGETEAVLVAGWISHLSPFDMAFHFVRHFILGSPLDLGYLICIPVWLLIGIHGIRHGSRVYMDVFFRRV